MKRQSGILGFVLTLLLPPPLHAATWTVGQSGEGTTDRPAFARSAVALWVYDGANPNPTVEAREALLAKYNFLDCVSEIASLGGCVAWGG